MARTGPYPPEDRKWNYILLLKNNGAYFGDTLWVVFKQLILHRYNHWKRGDGWVD